MVCSRLLFAATTIPTPTEHLQLITDILVLRDEIMKLMQPCLVMSGDFAVSQDYL